MFLLFTVLNVFSFVMVLVTDLSTHFREEMFGLYLTLFIQAAINIIVIVFDLQLILFHIWIFKRGISTFDYIIFKREEKQKMQKVKDGVMTRAEFIEWKDQALVNPSRPKSKL